METVYRVIIGKKNNLVNTDYISFVPLLVEKISTPKVSLKKYLLQKY